MKRLPLTLGTLITLAGCDAAPEAGPSQVDVPDEPLSVETEPLLSVGVVTGDTLQEFDRVVTPFVLPDGRLVVPLGGSSEIRMFSQEGTFVGRLGGSGDGPGEFRYLSAAWPRGDTIEAFDGRLRRVTGFKPDGAVDVVAIAGGEYPDMVAALGPMEGGWAIGGVASGGRGQRDVLAFHHFDRDGTHLGELAASGGIIRYAGGNYSGPEPMSPRSVFRSDGTRLYFGDTLEPLIRRVRSPGTMDGEIVWTAAESGSAEDVFGEVVDEAVFRAGPERAEETRQRLQAAPASTQLSVFWDFHVDPAGFIWIQPYEPTAHAFAVGAPYRGGVGSGGAWQVMTPDGRFAGSIDVPDGLEVTQISRTAVVGIRRDELGVETVHVHRVNRRS